MRLQASSYFLSVSLERTCSTKWVSPFDGPLWSFSCFCRFWGGLSWRFGLMLDLFFFSRPSRRCSSSSSRISGAEYQFSRFFFAVPSSRCVPEGEGSEVEVSTTRSFRRRRLLLFHGVGGTGLRILYIKTAEQRNRRQPPRFTAIQCLVFRSMVYSFLHLSHLLFIFSIVFSFFRDNRNISTCRQSIAFLRSYWHRVLFKFQRVLDSVEESFLIYVKIK